MWLASIINIVNIVETIMSEFWVSNAKYWCQYCKKYIADNKSSRALHEGGRAHKEAVEKFLRDIYKRGNKEEKEKENVQKELKRIEEAAARAYARDTNTPLPPKSNTASSSKPKPPLVPPPPPPRPAEAYESLPELTTIPGAWVPVTKPPLEKQEEKARNELTEKGEDAEVEPSKFQAKASEIVVHDFVEDEDPDDIRNFQIVEKTLEVGNLNEKDGGEEDVSGLFKKRKITGKDKARNVRKKL